MAGVYEFKVIGDDGGKYKNDEGKLVNSSSSDVFKVTVENVNRPPILSKIPNQTIKESQILSKINMNDESKLILDIKLARTQNPKKTKMRTSTFKN